MAEPVIPGPVCENTPIREATCIHTKKIYDSCQAKDCLEDLRVYLTDASQTLLESAQAVKAAKAELLYVSVSVEPVGFHRGFYAVDLRYYYKISAEAVTGACRTAAISGLAVFDKRCMLFGSQGMAKTFTSDQPCKISHLSYADNLPTALVEAVDPVVLGIKLVEKCACPCACTCPVSVGDLPQAILDAFDGGIDFDTDVSKYLLVTLGQFSILRMERDSQLLIPVYDYCMPHKECQCDGPAPEDPCQLFQQIEFPVGEFFPPAGVEEVCPPIPAPAPPCACAKRK